MKLFPLNKDIYKILLTLINQDFKAEDIMLSLMSFEEYQIRKDSLYRFVLHHLHTLIKAKLLTKERKGRCYVYTLSEAFYQEEFKLTKKPKTAEHDQHVEDMNLLKQEIQQFNAELNLALAEAKEYTLLGKRYRMLKGYLHDCQLQNAQKTIELTAKVNTRNTMLKLIKK